MQMGRYSIILAEFVLLLDLRGKKDIPCNTSELSFQSLNTTVTFFVPMEFCWHKANST